MQLSVLADVLNLAAKGGDAMADLAPVHFQFRFAGTSCADSTAKAGQVFSIACKPVQPVVELGQLHLELAFLGAGTTGKNVQDQSGAVDDFGINSLFQIPLLAGREVIVN